MCDPNQTVAGGGGYGSCDWERSIAGRGVIAVLFSASTTGHSVASFSIRQSDDRHLPVLGYVYVDVRVHQVR